MRVLITMVALGLLVLTQVAEANCHKSKHKHTGPVGPTGAAGPVGPQGATGYLVSNYASGASDVQSIIFTGANFPINFTSNLVSPVGIVHPYQTDDSKFLIENGGIYQIGWTVPVEWDVTLKNEVELFLYDATTSTYFLPSPISKAAFDDITTSNPSTRFITLSGQTIIQIAPGTVLQLLIHVTGVITGVERARFTISQIANY